MAELYEILIPTHWVKLSDLIETELSGSFEIFNAGREHDVVDILYAESDDIPTNDDFHKLLYRQKGVIIEFSSTPIWVKSELKQAKVIISEPQTDSPAKAYNIKYKGYDVQIQDQYSDIINYYMRRLIRPLIVNTAIIDTYSLIVEDATSVTVGNSICIQENTRTFQAKILNKTGNTLTLDTPFDYTFTSEAILYECSFDLNVDGSNTPVIASFQPIHGLKFDITSIAVEIIDNDPMDDEKFGGLTKLTKGLVLRKADAVHHTIFNAKTNGELKLVSGATNPYSDKAPASSYGFAVRFKISDSFGVVIRLDGSLGENIQAIIQDNLTGLSKFRILVQGHFVES